MIKHRYFSVSFFLGRTVYLCTRPDVSNTNRKQFDNYTSLLRASQFKQNYNFEWIIV